MGTRVLDRNPFRMANGARMIKMLVGEMLTLILTEENFERMKKGDPIIIDLQTMGSPSFRYLQMGFSPNLKETMEKLKPFIGPETRVHGRES